MAMQSTLSPGPGVDGLFIKMKHIQDLIRFETNGEYPKYDLELTNANSNSSFCHFGFVRAVARRLNIEFNRVVKRRVRDAVPAE